MPTGKESDAEPAGPKLANETSVPPLAGNSNNQSANTINQAADAGGGAGGGGGSGGGASPEKKKTEPVVIAAIIGAFVAIVGGLIAAFANIYVTYLNASNQLKLDENKHKQEMATEAYKAEASRVLEAVKSGDSNHASCLLRFLSDTGLLRDDDLRQKIEIYIATRPGGSGVGSGAADQGCASAVAQSSPPPPTPTPTRTPSPSPSVNASIQPSPPSTPLSGTPLSSPTSSPSPQASATATSQIFPVIVQFSTEWMGGGHNQNEACATGISEYQTKYPGKIVRRISSDEQFRKDVIGHVEYKYYCNIGIYDPKSEIDNILSEVIPQLQSVMSSASHGCSGESNGVPPENWPSRQALGLEAVRLLSNAKTAIGSTPNLDNDEKKNIENLIISGLKQWDKFIASLASNCSGGSNGIDPVGYGSYVNLRDKINERLREVMQLL